MLILLAGEAAQDRNWQTAYNIASQIDDALPAGVENRRRSRSAYATITPRWHGSPAPSRSIE